MDALDLSQLFADMDLSVSGGCAAEPDEEDHEWL